MRSLTQKYLVLVQFSNAIGALLISLIVQDRRTNESHIRNGSWHISTKLFVSFQLILLISCLACFVVRSNGRTN